MIKVFIECVIQKYFDPVIPPESELKIQHLPRPRFCFQLTTMRFHNIVAQRQLQSRALTGWLGREKGLKDFIPPFLRYTVTIVGDAYFHILIHLFRTD